MPRPRDGGTSTIEQVVKDPPSGDTPAPAPPAREPAQLLELPTEKSMTSGDLGTKTILMYGPAGIGKSTLASEFGEVLFADTAGELDSISAYKIPITSRREFRLLGATIKADRKQFVGLVIDTIDKLQRYYSQAARADLQITHESDAEYGKGWSHTSETFSTDLAKFLSIPDFGIVMVSHSKETEIKTRSGVYTKSVPTLTGALRDEVVNVADLVLFIDWAQDEQGGRVIRTKPSQYWDAKERGMNPRLPAEISWPVGKSGYDVLVEAWNE